MCNSLYLSLYIYMYIYIYIYICLLVLIHFALYLHPHSNKRACVYFLIRQHIYRSLYVCIDLRASPSVTTDRITATPSLSPVMCVRKAPTRRLTARPVRPPRVRHVSSGRMCRQHWASLSVLAVSCERCTHGVCTVSPSLATQTHVAARECRHEFKTLR